VIRISRPRAVVADPIDAVLVAALISMIVLVAGDPMRAIVGAVFCLLGLGIPGLRSRPYFWLGLAAVYLLWFFQEYASADDHLALAAYWYGAIGLSLRSQDPLIGLRFNARALIGLTFLLAVGWKLRSPDFVSGTFFEYELLTDPRFRHVALWLGGVTPADLVANMRALGSAPISIELNSSRAVATVAGALTVGTLVVEPLVAMTWLGGSRRFEMLRHVVLGAFCFLTYVVVPVAGFGTILLAMAIGHASTRRIRAIYLAAIGALFVWSSLLQLFWS
jgi:hypothetical protein